MPSPELANCTTALGTYPGVGGYRSPWDIIWETVRSRQNSFKRPHYAEKRVALCPFLHGRACILIVFAADVVILGWLRRYGFLLGLLYLAWCPAQVCLTPNRSLPGTPATSL